MSKVKLVCADIGSFNIKISGSVIYENRFKLDNGQDIFGIETLELDGNIYIQGQGKFDKTFTKTKKNIEVPLLYAIGKENIEGDINLILHLPASQMPLKGELVERLQGKTFKFKVNGSKKQVTFKMVGVLKEGFSAFYSLPRRNKGLISIIDIGGRTSDVFTFKDGVQQDEKSFKYGTLNLFELIAEHLTGLGEERDIEEIHDALARGILNIDEFTHITENLFKELNNEIKFIFPNLKDYNIKLCGGGADYFEPYFKKEYPKVALLDNRLTSNVEGADSIGKAKGLDK